METPVDHSSVAVSAAASQLLNRLRQAVSGFDEPGADYRLAGQPAAASFTVSADGSMSHVSRPLPEELAETAAALVASLVESRCENSHLWPLAVACLCVVDDGFAERFGLETLRFRQASLRAIDDESARHEPQLKPHDGALRVWTPLVAMHRDERPIANAIIELQFDMGRRPRYAPWEGHPTGAAPGQNA